MERVEATAVTGVFQAVASVLKLPEPSSGRDESDGIVGGTPDSDYNNSSGIAVMGVSDW